jgi:hypothetical protein
VPPLHVSAELTSTSTVSCSEMRELRGAGMVTVELIPTEINPADIFTKILSRQVFEKHRKTVLNLTDRRPRPQPPYPSTRMMSTWLVAGGGSVAQSVPCAA